MLLVIIFLGGLTVGSFISAFTYRYPRALSIKKGRSVCDNCKKEIAWFDNIPLVSYAALGGKCRNCGKKISVRYPFIESITGISFVTTFFFMNSCATTFKGLSLQGGPLCSWTENMGVLSLPYFAFLLIILMSIFVIDLEHKLIFDDIVFLAAGVVLIALALFMPERVYEHLLAGFATSLFLLFIHIATRGRGMGLGDVKFALFGGFLLGLKSAAVWVFLSFILGGAVGVLLIFVGKARFGKEIPFGPFLVISLFITLVAGGALSKVLFPFFN